MSGDSTYQGLTRLTYMPDRDSSDNGLCIAGQNYFDVYFTGGEISNVSLVNASFTNPVFDTPISLANGGTSANLADPNADRIMFWDDSLGAMTWLTAGSGLVITDTTLTVAGVGLGDVTGPVSSVDNQIARFDGTTGKVIQTSSVTINDIGNISTSGTIAASNLSGTNTGDQTITLTGDVTGTGKGSFVTAIGANKVTNSMIRQSSALSVVGRASNSTGNVADIAAGSDGAVLRRSGTTLGFGAINLASSNAVTGILPVANGGTNATTVGDARTSLDVYSKAETDAKVIRSGTAVAAAGTSVDFTGIPSTAKFIVISMAGLSTNGTSSIIAQIGDSGGVENSGYAGNCMRTIGTSVANSNFIIGFVVSPLPSSSDFVSGSITLSLINSATNTWACTGMVSRTDAASTSFFSGDKSLTATLDRIRITTGSGTDTFDAGTINILYS